MRLTNGLLAGLLIVISAQCEAYDQDPTYGVTPGGSPEYCKKDVPASRSCQIERQVNEIADAAAKRVSSHANEFAKLDPSSPSYPEDSCRLLGIQPAEPCIAAAREAQVYIAKGIPAYQIDTYCARIADAGDGSSQIELTCRQQEYAARAWLGQNDVAQSAMKYCAKIGQSAGGSYQILKTCIEQEQHAQSQL